MNNIFIDIVDTNKLSYKQDFLKKILLKLLGFYIGYDKLLKTKFSTNSFLVIDNEKTNIINIKNFILIKFLKSKLNRITDSNVIFSKNILNEKSLKRNLDEVFELLKNKYNSKFKYVISNNKLKELDINYIEKYINESKINKLKFKLLVVIDNFKDLDKNNLIKYIENYKFVDILKTQNVNKMQYKKLSSIVNNINSEYGCCIEIIQKRNIQNYDFCVIYSKGIKEHFKTHYILNKKAYILDITDVDDDIMSKEYKKYVKNEGYISTLFNRINLDIDNFLKSEIGSLYN